MSWAGPKGHGLASCADDVICANIEVHDLTDDRFPHKLLGTREGIQSIMDRVKTEESQATNSKHCQSDLPKQTARVTT